MTGFSLMTPPELKVATGEQLDRWAFLYGAIRGGGTLPGSAAETDAKLRARLIQITTGKTLGA